MAREKIKEKKNRYVMETVNYGDLFSREYKEHDWVKYGLPTGCVGSVIGAGSTGKSYLAIEDGMTIASGKCEEVNIKRGGVLYIPAEDPIEEIGRRIKAIGEYFKYSEEQIDNLNANFIVWSLLGQSPDLMEMDGDESRPLVDAICELASTKFKRDPVRLVVFDTLRRMSFADENDSGQMSKLLSCMEIICNRLNCACMFLHHTSKGASLNGQARVQQAARGSSVLSDNIRYQECLSPMTPEESEKYGEVDDDGNVRSAVGAGNRGYYVYWNCPKQNYGIPLQDVWLKRVEGGVLVPVDLEPVSSSSGSKKKGSRDGGEV